MRTTRLGVALVGIALLALGACGNDEADADAGDAARCLPEAVDCEDTPPAAGMCLEGTPDCVDTIAEGEPNGSDPGAGDAFDSESEREAAKAMLGLSEAELAPDVRIGRKGSEQMMLTEDYVLGRKTVELDPDANGVYRVTKVTVELPDGPEHFVA